MALCTTRVMASKHDLDRNVLRCCQNFVVICLLFTCCELCNLSFHGCISAECGLASPSPPYRCLFYSTFSIKRMSRHEYTNVFSCAASKPRLSGSLWHSCIFFCLFLLAACVTITHVQLLLLPSCPVTSPNQLCCQSSEANAKH